MYMSTGSLFFKIIVSDSRTSHIIIFIVLKMFKKKTCVLIIIGFREFRSDECTKTILIITVRWC